MSLLVRKDNYILNNIILRNKLRGSPGVQVNVIQEQELFIYLPFFQRNSTERVS